MNAAQNVLVKAKGPLQRLYCQARGEEKKEEEEEEGVVMSKGGERKGK